METMSQSFDIQDNLYYLGEPVIYSAFPDVANGTGIVTPDGIKSTGATLQEMDARDIGETCPFENLDDIRIVTPAGPYTPTHGL